MMEPRIQNTKTEDGGRVAGRGESGDANATRFNRKESMSDDIALPEALSTRCQRCGEALDADALSEGHFTKWPAVVPSEDVSDMTHGGCGGRLLLGDIRPLGNVCAEGCECQSGGLLERAVW